MTNSRRGFLKKTLGSCWTGAALLEQSLFRATQARAQAQAKPGLPSLFDIEKVADGVYAAVAKPALLLNCNAAIFENANDILIVDTHSKPSAVYALVSQIRREVTTKPVRYIVNSHFHWDHSQGTPAYRRIFPHADVVSSERTRALLSENGSERLKASTDQVAKSLDDYKRRLAAAKSPAEKQLWQGYVRESNEYLSEMKNYSPELPNVTFDHDLIIRDKSHDLHLAFRGRAHTAGDVFVFCPQKKVVSTGDVLHGFAPFIADGYPVDWQNTLLRVAEMPFQHVIGGHGGVQHSRQRLYNVINYLSELTEQVQAGKNGRKTLDQIQQIVVPAKLKSLRDGGYGDFLLENSRKYTVPSPDDDPSQALANKVKTNVAEVFAALERS
jgi:glyoxylase-like metal-dependent hydrolase (beta-lactamase superfamily II)